MEKAKKPGRPKSDEPLSEHLTLRFTTAEMDRLQWLAARLAASGSSLRAWARLTLLEAMQKEEER